MLIEEIDGVMPAAHPLAPYLVEAGFVAGAMGFQPNFVYDAGPEWGRRTLAIIRPRRSAQFTQGVSQF